MNVNDQPSALIRSFRPSYHCPTVFSVS